MAASLDDILTTQKNGVVAINGLNRTLQLIEADLPCICTNLAGILVQLQDLVAGSNPTNSHATVVATTSQVVVGSGIMFSVSIPDTSGSNQVLIYDSATTGGIAASNLIYGSLPANAANFVPYRDVRIRYTNGLVIVAGTGMSCVLSYTPNI
jgi:hypothetical protein